MGLASVLSIALFLGQLHDLADGSVSFGPLFSDPLNR